MVAMIKFGYDRKNQLKPFIVQRNFLQLNEKLRLTKTAEV